MLGFTGFGNITMGANKNLINDKNRVHILLVLVLF